jgi:hypothetical protein
MAENRDDDLRRYDQVVAFISSVAGRELLREQGREAVIHFLPRVGWNVRNDDDVIEIQQDTALLRRLRTQGIIDLIFKRLDQLEAGFEMHKELQVAQHHQNQTKLDEIKAVVDGSAGERAAIKSDIGELKRAIVNGVLTVMGTIVLLLVAALAWYLTVHGLPGGAK